MPWLLDDTRIFVVDQSTDDKQIIARLQPVASGSVYHVFGWESQIRKLKCYVVSGGNVLDLRGMVKDGIVHTLTSPWDAVDYYVGSVNGKQLHSVCQTFDTTKPTDDVVWELDLELFKESAL